MSTRSIPRGSAWALAALGSALQLPAQAQDYPSRPVRLVVPWAAGGSTDSIGRILAQKLAEYLGQQWIIDNRGGATGTIGHAFVARAAPDGYTLLLGTNSTFAIAPHLYRNLQYDNEKAFAPISLVAISPQILSGHPSLPVASVKELIALARAKPGAVPFSTAGVGATSHLATELLQNMARIRMTHVPYKGGGPSAQALIGGETALSFVDVITALPQARAGRLRAIACSTATRTALMPELPTISESGLLGFESATTFAMFAPAGAAPEIAARARDRSAGHRARGSGRPSEEGNGEMGQGDPRAGDPVRVSSVSEPGEAYGLSPYCRMSIAASSEELEEACRRMRSAAAALA